ncbi:MAG: hypothetical protein LC623_09015 [Halobacteriales archaeon]|nr:hypothetical protein [Halobacteriales archaeon]
MQDAWNTFASRLRTKLDELKAPSSDWTEDELIVYLRDYKRRKASTIGHRLAQLRFMERHEAMPVNLHGGRFALVNSFYLYVRYRETVEEAPATTLINDHKSVKVLGDFLGIPREVWPTAPTEPHTDERWIPLPEDVHALLHSNYTPTPQLSYDNALVKAILVLDFGFGVRCPSEAWILKKKDFMPDKHLIVVTEPKKSGRRRTLMIEPEWLCCSRRHPSLANFLVWRKKVDPNDEQEDFFLRADGTPFPSKHALNKFVNDLVKPRFPWFHPYLGRHWSVNARLIDWGFDYTRVADWHGHETVDMTRREYDHNARMLARLHGKDWLNRVARARLTDKAA